MTIIYLIYICIVKYTSSKDINWTVYRKVRYTTYSMQIQRQSVCFSSLGRKENECYFKIFLGMHFKVNIWLKNDLITDKMKEAMVAKIAHQCSELFSDAMKLMQLASLKDLWPKVSSVCEMNRN